MFLSHEEHEIRAVTAGGDNVLAFTRIDGSWISEGNEHVAIELEWQGREVSPSPSCSEDDYICPKEFAAHLISKLFSSGEWKEAVARKVYDFGADRCTLPLGGYGSRHREEID